MPGTQVTITTAPTLLAAAKSRDQRAVDLCGQSFRGSNLLCDWVGIFDCNRAEWQTAQLGREGHDLQHAD